MRPKVVSSALQFMTLDLIRDTCISPDVDECKAGISQCSHTCVNKNAGHVCLCPVGMIVGKDHKTCEGWLCKVAFTTWDFYRFNLLSKLATATNISWLERIFAQLTQIIAL